MKKFFSFFVVTFLSLMMGEAFAASRTFYFQATALSNSETAGLVYASFANAAPADSLYADSITTDVYSKSAGSIFSTPSNTTATLRLYAQPAEGFRFLGWKNAADAESYVSTALNYSPTVTSQNYGNAANPALFTYYAFFEEVTETYSSSVVAATAGEGEGLVSVALASGSTEFAATMTASDLGNMYASHTYYLQAKPVDAAVARFAGWYSDAECTNRLSQNATYTYNVTATSIDEANPTLFPVYAKFDLIPYYCSSVTVNAQGEGLVDVVLANNATAEYQATSTKAQRVADKTAHTYYLRAQSNDADMVDFDGWYTDAACTEHLSSNASYTYKVTAASLDSLAPTAFVAYAKFVARNPYQFRNGGFEKWNDALTEPTPGWSGPASAIGGFAGTASGLAPAPERVEGRTGDYAVRLTSKTATILIISVKTNGNLTTGVMNMGSATATDASNNNHTVVGDAAHSLIIVGQPDSLEYYSKYKKGENKDYMASAKVYLHAGINYQDPVVNSQKESCMGYCYTPAPESEDWIRNVGAFTYADSLGWTVDSVAEQTIYVLCDLTTNPTAGGSTKDTLVIDDIRFIYNSELATATFAGDTLAFENGAANVNSEYSEDSLLLVSNARNAAIETEFNTATALLTVTVKGNDVEFNPENKHIYTIQFVPATATSFESLEAAPEVKKVMINGQLYILRGEQMFDALGRQIR